MRKVMVNLAPYYTVEHNEAMSCLIKNLKGITLLGTVVDEERGILHSVECDDQAFKIIQALSNADCLYVE